jgi:hypothetical protein
VLHTHLALVCHQQLCWHGARQYHQLQLRLLLRLRHFQCGLQLLLLARPTLRPQQQLVLLVLVGSCWVRC